MNSDMMLEIFNYAEGALWILIAAIFVGFLVTRRVRNHFVPLGWVMAATLAIFGCTDFIETASGAWWDPWWLAVIKGLCILSMLAGAWIYWRYSKKEPREKNSRGER